MTELDKVARALVELTETHREEVKTHSGTKQHSAATDGRWANRRRQQLPAYVMLNGHGSDIPCTVLDISSTGLSLETKNGSPASGLPDTITVYIPNENVQYDSTVIRRDGNQAGVKFTAPPRMVAKQPKRLVKQAPQKKSMIRSLFGK